MPAHEAVAKHRGWSRRDQIALAAARSTGDSWSVAPVETLRVVHIDDGGCVIGVTEHDSAWSNRVEVPMRRIVADALRLGSSALILSHTHPGGVAKPSRADIAVTRRVSELAAALGIRLHDHVVTGEHDSFSFRAAGLL